MANPLNDDRIYNREAVLADSIWEFHPDAFAVLNEEERRAFLLYYPQDLDNISDQFSYRRSLLAHDQHAAEAGRNAFRKVLESIEADTEAPGYPRL